MENTNVLEQLRNSFKDKEWFYDVGIGEFGKHTVYVNFMNLEVLTSVPNSIDGTPVYVHYASSLKVNKEQFVTDKSKPMVNIQPKITWIDEEDEPSLDLSKLTDELDRLEGICGPNILQDIFYESHDKHNAITNLSPKYPDVRLSMDKLYEEYGFDVIYGEMEV
ncbi:hypothetical protein UFOVP1290_378 [uncultured Caudovirales phage]|uniref:Uncharacterized protein n=1 Tax=uncultured Caudovirales phage TaxID=2100421 RepID=A0A6J5RTE7_9CAUD|nr:hypothetical protein UFOVP1290_378 [uncultured Caudovirales phage]